MFDFQVFVLFLATLFSIASHGINIYKFIRDPKK